MENSNDNVRAQMRKGVLEYCILCILSNKEAYASSILEELKAVGMLVVEGTLYPLLIRQKKATPSAAGMGIRIAQSLTTSPRR